MPTPPDVLLIGGGLAGLTAALHLRHAGLTVTVLEKQAYPHHKVCGEYVSNEVLPYLTALGVSLTDLGPTSLQRFRLGTEVGRLLETPLPLGGFGLSRYALDARLAQVATQAGVIIKPQQVTDITFSENKFHVQTSMGETYTAPVVLGAYGKRAALDKQLQRPFWQKPSPWVAVKAHYQADFLDDLVGIYTFPGGYCGLSKVENGVVNACYLAHTDSFGQHKNLDTYRQQVLAKNPFLRQFFAEAKPLFDKPLTISQVSFSVKKPVENHVLMIGDTAGLIHPICGNGMAMAIQGARLASEQVIRFWRGQIDRQTLETAYTSAWRQQFGRRLQMGRIVQTVLQQKQLTDILLNVIAKTPTLLTALIRQTHGRQEPISDSLIT